CRSYPKTMIAMLEAYDLNRKGLEKVKSNFERGNVAAACENLLSYYRHSNNAMHLRRDLPVTAGMSVATADTTLENVFIVQNVRGKVPYGPDGHRDWYYKGPNNDREWAWLSNRHSQILQVMEAYFDSGNPKYVRYIDAFLRDFIIKSMPYPAAKSSTSVWRGLEVAARAKVWSKIFYGLMDSEYLTPATRLLILASLPDHAHYNRNFHAGNNWLTMEISALATVATNFPEYKASDEWLEYSINSMLKSMKDQVYPDGVQTELTSHYHNVSLFNFELFKNICDQAGKELPEYFGRTIENMYSYIAHAVRPDGYRALNNDGDRGIDREHILRAAEIFQHIDWKYIASNGSAGKRPDDGPSYFYPWAGQLISRSDFSVDAHWSFFDVGPWGSGHQHNDKLHLSVSAYGRDFLVDAGRFAYTGETAEKFRPYARSTAGHNLVLIDGKGQAGGPTHATVPIDERHWEISDKFDYATGAFTDFPETEGDVRHSRSVFYVRGEFWIVVDRLTTERPRKIETLWHWHPDCQVLKVGRGIRSDYEKGNLQVIPISAQNFEIEFIKGQEEPEIQGWYSREYNIYEPNITSRFTTEIKQTSTLAWLLFPSEEKSPKASARIESENETKVQISVRAKGRVWDINIPFEGSNDGSGPVMVEGI
ncbi:MAG: alginate lyase family protein, partial [Saprospiraceae bacterium]|nr:alginate lyase family protein [Saprospiraceae bacterium]